MNKHYPSAKFALCSLFAALSLWLAACGSTSATSTPRPTKGPFPTLTPGLWRVSNAVITVDNAPQLAPLGNLSGHTDTVNTLAFSANGHSLVSVDAVSRAVVWNLDTGQQRYVIDNKSETRLAFFGPNDASLITIGVDDTVRFYIPESGSLLSSTPANREGVVSADLSPDRRLLATGGLHGDILLWDVPSQSRARAFTGGTGFIRTLAFSPDSSLLAAIVRQTAEEGGTLVRLWRVTTGELLTTVGNFEKDKIDPYQLAFSPDGKMLAIAAQTQIRMVDTITGDLKFTIFQDNLLADQQIAFSSDGQFFASLSKNDYVYVWRMDDARTPVQLPRHGGAASSLAFSPNSQLFLTTSSLVQGGAFIWQTRTFAKTATEFPRGVIAPNANGIYRGFWSPNGKLIVLAEASGSLIVYGIPAS